MHIILLVYRPQDVSKIQQCHGLCDCMTLAIPLGPLKQPLTLPLSFRPLQPFYPLSSLPFLLFIKAAILLPLPFVCEISWEH
jgi:hypothetical protein